MYLIDEEDIVLLQRSEDAGQIAGLVEHGAGSQLKADAQLVGNDVGKRGFAQSRRAVKQRVVERLATELGCLDEDAQILHHLRLTAEVVEGKGTKGVFKVLLFLLATLVDVKFHTISELGTRYSSSVMASMTRWNLSAMLLA